MDKILLVVLIAILSGCSLFTKEVVHTKEDPYCRAIKEVPYEPEEPDLSVEQYNNIDLSARIDENGNRIIEMSVDDYEKLIKIFGETENFIREREVEMDSMIEYYDPDRFNDEEKKEE